MSQPKIEITEVILPTFNCENCNRIIEINLKTENRDNRKQCSYLTYNIMKVNKDGKTYKVCKKCYNRYKKNKHFENIRFKLPSHVIEENKRLRNLQRIKILTKKLRDMKNEKTALLLKMSPDELLKQIDENYKGF